MSEQKRRRIARRTRVESIVPAEERRYVDQMFALISAIPALLPDNAGPRDFVHFGVLLAGAVIERGPEWFHAYWLEYDRMNTAFVEKTGEKGPIDMPRFLAEMLFERGFTG